MKVNINDTEFEAMHESKIVSSGNGGVAKSYKKYIGQEVIILVKKKNEIKKENESKQEIMENIRKAILSWS